MAIVNSLADPAGATGGPNIDGRRCEADRLDMHSRFVALAGSERRAAPGARLVGPADPDEQLEVTLVLRPPPRDGADPPRDQVGAASIRLTRAEFARTESARPQDVERARAFAAEFGLRVIRISPIERTIALAGSVGSCARAFRVELGQYELGGATYRGREGSIHLPEALAEGVIAVLGLDDRPAAERR